MNAFTFLFLFVLAAGLVVDWYLARRHIQHIRRHRDQVPAPFASQINLADHQKAADYTIAKTGTGMIDSLIGAAVLLIWTLGGGLEALDRLWRGTGLGSLTIGTAFILCIVLISAIIDLPMSVYRTFKLEQRFGFNKTTVKTFCLDLLKNTALLLLIGTPMIALVVWITDSAGSLWWLYVWLTWLVFSLFFMWAYPAFIAPLFNDFRPLENTELKSRIEQLLARNGFTTQGIFVMDGSTRSAHGNAYFTGLGANKRIVFFDTLIGELSMDEIEAVLAHELGHFKCNHIRKRIAVLASLMFTGLATLGWLIDAPWFYQGLGVATPSTYMALTLFFMVIPVFVGVLQPLMSYLSRQHEFEADAFAAAQAHSTNLIRALVKLYRENANTLTPDPLYSAFYDSHPPAPVRIAHLQAQPG